MSRKNHDGEENPQAVGPWVKLRMGFVFVGFCGFFGLVIFRLVQLQILPNAALDTLAQKQFEKTGVAAPYRLAIYDRNREELAVSIPSTSLFARPKLIIARRRTARLLTKHLGESPEFWLKKLDPQKNFIWLKRQLAEADAKTIVNENIPGIFAESENKRFYPNGTLAASAIGFTDLDGNGISGLELSLNEELLQKGSKYPLPRDGKGNPSYIDKKYYRPDDGKTGVYVTLDRRIQYVVEEELERAQEEVGGKAILAIVMDPFTGEILGLGQKPSFDPNRLSSQRADAFTNRFTSFLYEPGSTMKVILSAEAIQQGLLNKNSLINCENGDYRIGKKKINEAESHHKFGVIPLKKVIEASSNIGAVKVAQVLGIDRVRATLEKFGLTRKTGINLPGEVAPPIKPDKFWTPLTLATVGFGQGISLTPIQMVASFAPFANGGYLVRPRILLRESIADGELGIRKILTPQTADTMREILTRVTESEGGTGFLARIPGISVAGKTGTAQKYEAGVGYSGKKYFSSFIGFLPANQPELLVSIMIDEPKPPYYAAQVAAPLFRRIAERSLQILGRAPKTIVNSGTPSKNLPEPTKEQVVQETADGKRIMPDLKDLSLRETIQLIGRHVESIKVEGAGYLTSQTPSPGTSIDHNTRVALHFSPK